MKIWRKGIGLCLSLVLVVSLVGCSAGKSLKVIDAGDFEDILNDMDYSATVYDDEDSLSKGQVEAAYAFDENYEYYAIFAEYEEKKDAADDFNDMMDDLKNAKDDDEFDGKYTKTSGGNYQKCVINGEFSDSSGDFAEGTVYQVAFQIDKTIIVVMAYDNGKSDVKEVDKIVKELGY
jgi:predicted nucleotidyltransferase